MLEQIEQRSAECAELLLRQAWRLVLAESCTGGWLAKVLTDLPGSSGWLDRCYVTYSDSAKQQMLGVQPQTLADYGAVSEQVVVEMAAGALTASGVDIAIAISGIAGPSGGSEEKPVGTVCFCIQTQQQMKHLSTQLFSGDRDAIRRQSVRFALVQLQQILSDG